MIRASLLLACVIAVAPGCSVFRSSGAPSCPADRVVQIGLQEDVQKLAGCPKVAGLTIRTGATIDVSPLSELEEITGDLAVGPTVGVDTIALNGLLRVGGTIRVVNNGSLRGLFFPRLEHVGRIEVDGNAVLTTISMPRLLDVQQSMVITDNHGLELVSATSLTTIGSELVIVGHPRLNLLELPRVAHLQALRLEGVPQVPAEVADALRAKAAAP